MHSLHAYWDHPQIVFGGLYRYVKFGWNRRRSFDNMKVVGPNIVRVWPKNAYSRWGLTSGRDAVWTLGCRLAWARPRNHVLDTNQHGRHLTNALERSVQRWRCGLVISLGYCDDCCYRLNVMHDNAMFNCYHSVTIFYRQYQY